MEMRQDPERSLKPRCEYSNVTVPDAPDRVGATKDVRDNVVSDTPAAVAGARSKKVINPF
jgi:hypothetical protein